MKSLIFLFLSTSSFIFCDDIFEYQNHKYVVISYKHSSKCEYCKMNPLEKIPVYVYSTNVNIFPDHDWIPALWKHDSECECKEDEYYKENTIKQ